MDELGLEGVPLQDVARVAYERLLPVYMALPASVLRPINVDVGRAVALGLAAAASVPEFRARMEPLGSELELVAIDNLEAAAYGLAYAQAGYVLARTPRGNLRELHGQGVELRKKLLLSARALSASGLMVGEQFEKTQGTVGYRNLAMDLTGLSKAFLDRWDQLANKTPITREELDQASNLAVTLLRDSIMHERKPLRRPEAIAIRQRAFAYLVHCHGQVALAFRVLRWREGDWWRYATSPYTGRNNGGRRKQPAQVHDDPAAEVTPDATSSEPSLSN